MEIQIMEYKFWHTASRSERVRDIIIGCVGSALAAYVALSYIESAEQPIQDAPAEVHSDHLPSVD